MTAINSQYVHLHTVVAQPGNGGYSEADDIGDSGNNQATTAPFGTGGAATYRLNPLTAGTAAAVPAVNASPAGKGWWVTPGNVATNGYHTMNDASYWTRSVAGPGVWQFNGSVGQTTAATTSITITVIFYKMTSTTVGTEIGRGSATVTPTAGAETTFVITTGSVAAQTFTYGQTLSVEIYMTGTGLAAVGNTGTFYVGSTANNGWPFWKMFADPTATIIEPAAGGASTARASNASKVITVGKGIAGSASTARASNATKTVAVTKAGGGAESATATAHYTLVSYAISGFTRDDNTNTLLGGATVKLFDSTDTLQQTVTSNGSTGAYSFIVPAAFVGWVSAYKVAASNGSDIFGRTANGLTPQQTTVQSG